MKKQIKKSLSLMLAVLMVLSCWVWVAPTKAEAADTYYPIKVGFKINNSADGDGDLVEFKVFYKTDNGTGSTEIQHPVFQFKSGDNGGFDEGDEFILDLSGVPGFPTRVEFAVKDDSFWSGEIIVEWNALYIGDSGDLMDGLYTRDASASGWSDAAVETVGSATCPNWKYPYADNIKTKTTSADVKINKIGGADAPADLSWNVVDQYGVDWYVDPLGAEPTFKIYSDAAGVNEMTFDNDEVYISGSYSYTSDTSTISQQVKIKPEMQLSNVKTVYVGAQLGSSKIITVPINLTNPKYDWYFYGLGSTDSLYPVTIYMNNGDEIANEIKAIEYKEYDESIKDYYPTGEAIKEGHDFYGFWSVKQPEDESSSATPETLAEDFKQPISTDAYNNLSDSQKELYYPAGVKWDPKANSEQLKTKTDAENTYYAWWVAKDIKVKFYDIDGSHIQSFTVKYGDRNTAIATWPSPKRDQTEDYVNGAYTYSNWNGKWENYDGTEIYSGNHVFTEDLILTPVYNDVTFKKEYDVTVYNTYGSYTSKYVYRDTVNMPTAIPLEATDEFTFEFIGWANSAPTTGTNYHIVMEDADFDVNNHAVNLVEDFTVRDDVSYYPVFRRFINSYEVRFEYVDTTGNDAVKTKTFKYGEVITAPDDIPMLYAKEGKEYTFKSWVYNNNEVNLAGYTCVPNMTFKIKYNDGVAVPYNVTFEYRNAKGELVTKTAQVNHGSNITQETVDSLKPHGTYDDGEYLQTFFGKWDYNGKRYDTADLTAFSPENHVTFKAIYENGKKFHTVTYKDGSTTETFRETVGTKLPTWLIEDEDENKVAYLPKKADTSDGKYTFIGWADAEQTEEQIIAGTIAGNKYVPEETQITGDVTLYPQFSYGRFEYHFVFLNYDGTELAKGTYHYGDKIEATVNAAEANAVKASDETYNYQFIGWDKRVPTTCEGGEPDSTLYFVAQFKPVYIYYAANWYANRADVGGVDADGKSIAVATSKYIYGETIRVPSVNLTIPDGKALEGWYYCPADCTAEPCTEHKFVRGMTVTADINLFAKYKDAPIFHTVTVNDGTTTYEVKVENGLGIKDLVSDPADGWQSNEEHNEFIKWTLDKADAAADAYNLEAPVTSDIKIFANFEVKLHNAEMSEIITPPTYRVDEVKDEKGNVIVPASTGEGSKEIWCACDKEKTKSTVVIAPLTDAVIPTGTTYVGTTSWKYDTDFDAITETFYAAPSTDLIITTTDKGDYNADFNTAENGIGVKNIYVYTALAADGLPDGYENNESMWEGIYDWSGIQTSLVGYYGSWAAVPEVYKNYNANVTQKARDLKVDGEALVDGSEYITYYKIVDKNNNTNYIRTAKYVYDATAPELELVGSSNYAGEVFCEKVELVVEDANPVTVTLNGNAVELTENAYTINTAGAYHIVVTDKAGNKTTAYVEVLAAHETRTVKVDATCTTIGIESTECYNCNAIIGEIIETEVLGHDFGTAVRTDATCTENGYDTYTCSRCGWFEVVDFERDENGAPVIADGEVVLLDPAKGHSYGEFKVTKAATCVATGTKVKECTACGDKITEVIAIDEDAHKFYNPVTVKPTCTDAGRKTQTCRLCGDVVVIAQGSDATQANYDEAYKPTGHTEEWVVTKVATCKEKGIETAKCKVCKAIILVDDAPKTREIDNANVPHTWEATQVVEPTADAKGYTVYTCKICGATQKIEGEAALEKFTVTFYVDGAEYDKAEGVKGETIAAADVTAPTKANNAEGTKKYTFAGWYTLDENGDYKTKYNLPMTIPGDLELYAKFTESDVIYTVNFLVPDEYTDASGFTGYEEVKTLMGAIGDEREPAETPAFAENSKYTFKFVGWAKNSANASAVEGKIKIDGDASYYAKFEKEQKEYEVVFMNGTAGICSVKVKAGETAVYDAETYGTPTKAYDDENHYTFKGWDKALTNITAKTVVYAQYTATAHTLKETGKVTQEADCLLPEMTTYECTAECGYTETKKTADANGHTEKTELVDGKYVTICEVCKETIKEEAATYTIKFFDDGGVTRLGTIEVEMNSETATADVRAKAAAAEAIASKASDDENSYEFIGWAIEGTTAAKPFASDEIPEVTASVTYIAQYKAIPRVYRVTYLDKDGNVLQTGTYAYGSTEAGYKGETSKIVVPAANADGHFTFEKWSGDTSVVKKDIAVSPVFKQTEHTYTQSNTGATCTEPGGIKHQCACGYYYIAGNVPATGHDWVLAQEIAPDYATGTDGKRVYNCKNGCGQTLEEPISGQLAQIVVNVKDQNGNLINNALVKLFVKDAEGNYVDTGMNDRTKSDGVVIFYVQPGSYRVFVSVDGLGDASYDVNVDEQGNVDKGNSDVVIEKPVEDTSCSCSCHRDNFWGAFFRFFQKIIKLFTGKPSCCADPDSRI